MIGQTVVTGIVLNALSVGEYDRRLVIFTKELGKIVAFAKGARRQNSHLLASTQPFSFGKFEIYSSRKYYNVQSAQISNYFVELREDLNSISYGLYFLELVDYYIRDEQSDINVLKLLYQSLRALVAPKIKNDLVKCIFELKMAAYSGELSMLTECMCCGSNEELLGFSFQRGGMVCKDCFNKDMNVMKLKSATIYTMQYVVYSDIEKLYTFALKDDVLNEFNLFMKRYFDVNVEKKFKTLDMLSLV